MNLKSVAITALIGTLATAAFADVDWIIKPGCSASGRMIVQGTRDAGRGGKRIVPGMLLGTPEGNKAVKYRFLRIGSKQGFCFCGMNEKGLAIIYTGGEPSRDKNPAKVDGNTHKPHAATVIMLRSCATAEEAVRHMRNASKKRIVAGNTTYLIADPTRAFVVECSPGHFASSEIPHEFCVYSNNWRLPGMDGCSLGSAERTVFNFQREWAAREALRLAFDVRRKISVADSIRASRVSTEEANGAGFAKRRGKFRVYAAPYNSSSADSYLFELDKEFPGELSCVYAAYGPFRHTVYLPIPMGATDALPKEVTDATYLDSVYRLRDAANAADPVRPELLKFENARIAEFAKVRETARGMLRAGNREEARQLLRSTLAKQARATADFLNSLK